MAELTVRRTTPVMLPLSLGCGYSIVGVTKRLLAIVDDGFEKSLMRLFAEDVSGTLRCSSPVEETMAAVGAVGLSFGCVLLEFCRN